MLCLHTVYATVASSHHGIISVKHVKLLLNFVFFSSKRAVDESEVEAAERRTLRCVWATGGRALTEYEAAVEIVSEARLLLQEDLARLGIQWDPATLPPEAPALNSPENHSRESDTAPTSHLSSRDEQMDNTQDQREGIRVKTRATDGSRKENNAEYKTMKRTEIEKTERELKREQRNTKSEDSTLHRQQDECRTEPAIKHSNEGHVEKCEETNVDKTKKLLKAHGKKDLEDIEGQKQTRSKQEVNKGKGIVSIRPESQRESNSVIERNLTQELAEIVSSPLPQPMSPPQPFSSPVPPPRIRAPLFRVEGQHSVPPRTSGDYGTIGLVVSPVQSGRLKHSGVLSKVLHSIQTDKTPQGNIQVAQKDSKPAVVSLAQDPAPDVQVLKTIRTPVPMQEEHDRVSVSTDECMQTPCLSVSPASVPLCSPEAKRRRINGTELDKFSSPELYLDDDRDEDAEGAVDKGSECFGDSFELDTQTERIILQQTSQGRAGNETGMKWFAEREELRKEELLVVDVKLDRNRNEGGYKLEAPDKTCLSFNISITDSQMEFILNTSQQVSDCPSKIFK